MILYHGGSLVKEMRLLEGHKKVDTLITFADSKEPEWNPWYNHLFVDSGAFSVSNSGKTICVEEYAEYLKKWEVLKNKNKKVKIVCASLDVIGDPRAGIKNYKYLLKKGLDVIPCFHYGEPFEILEELASMSTYMGLGATVGRSNAERYLFFNRVFTRYPDPSKVGFHGFGISSPEMIKNFPWKTIDSTNALQATIFGKLYTPWGPYDISNKRDKKGHITQRLGHSNLKKVKDWLLSYNIDWETVQEDSKMGRANRVYANILGLECLIKTCPSVYIPRLSLFDL